MIVVSACLLGENCKYSGGNNYSPAVAEYIKGQEYLAFCPEVAGGLDTPRSPCERQGDRVVNRDGQDVTAQFTAGAQAALQLCADKQIDLAILKEQSPSCGVHRVYDGSFSGAKRPGQGVTAQLLAAHGITVVSDEDIAALPPGERL